jgi:hypothetical protein
MLAMDETRNRERLALADRHITEVNGYIVRLQQRIKRLGPDGRDIERARSLLDALEGSLRAFEFHRRLIVARLKPFDNASVALNERPQRAQQDQSRNAD